jgi:hypothetical protein
MQECPHCVGHEYAEGFKISMLHRCISPIFGKQPGYFIKFPRRHEKHLFFILIKSSDLALPSPSPIN